MPMRRTIGSSLACLVTSACAIAETEESRSAGRRIGAQASRRQQMDATVPRMPIAARCTRPGVASLEKRPGMAWWVAGPPSGEIVDTETATAAHCSLPLAAYAKVTLSRIVTEAVWASARNSSTTPPAAVLSGRGTNRGVST
jgi:hypothetical protein